MLKRLTFMAWAAVFFVFLSLSSEDRVYKNWKREIREFDSWHGEVKKWAGANLFPGATILIDIPEWKDWEGPFRNKCLGTIRKPLYQKAFPRSSGHLRRLSLLLPMPRIIRLDSRRRYREDKTESPLKIAPEMILSPRSLKNLMLSQRIDFYLCSFSKYGLKTRALSAEGFRLLHSNPRLMIWSVK